MSARTIIEEVDPSEPDRPRRCPYCVGGRISAEAGSSLRYTCPDCNGTGYIPAQDQEGDEPELEESVRCLSESLINGEFWIFEDGDIHYCDGDVGDTNHEGYAMQHAMRLVREAMNLDEVDEWDDADALGIAILRGWEEDATDEEKSEVGDDPYNIEDAMAKKHGVDRDLLGVALGRSASDPRQYAMQHWHWHALRGDHVETWQITSESLGVIASGILNALDEQSEEEVDPETEFWVNGYTGRRAVRLTYAQIESEDFGEDFKPAPQAPNDQVKKLDQQQSPDFYKGRLGDSARLVVAALCEAGETYRYFNNCVGWDREDVNAEGGLVDMIESRKDITRAAFLRKVDRKELSELETQLGYGSWLKMKDDFHVRYYQGTLHGQPVVFFVHSAIEYVFVPPGYTASRSGSSA